MVCVRDSGREIMHGLLHTAAETGNNIDVYNRPADGSLYFLDVRLLSGRGTGISPSGHGLGRPDRRLLISDYGSRPRRARTAVDQTSMTGRKLTGR